MGSCRSSSSNSWDALSGESNTVINVLNQSIVLIMSSPDRSRSGLLSSGLVSSAVVSSVESVLEDDDAMAGLSALQLEWVETLWTIFWLHHVSNDCISWNRLRWQKQQLIQLSSWHHSAKVRLVRHTVKETPKWNKCQSVTNVGRRSFCKTCIFEERTISGWQPAVVADMKTLHVVTTCQWVLLWYLCF